MGVARPPGRQRAEPAVHGSGVPTSTLMRQWIVERLALEQRRPADSTDAIWQAALDAVPRLAEDIAGQLAGRRST